LRERGSGCEARNITKQREEAVKGWGFHGSKLRSRVNSRNC
jgi:hypothetical protein